MADAVTTALVNYALSKIGGTGAKSYKISDIGASNDTARLCTALWPQIRKEVLCRNWWPEATKYAECEETEDNVEKADWEYAFDLPDDYLPNAPIIQIEQDIHRSNKPEYSYQYEKEIIGSYLLSNNYSNSDGDAVYVKYVYDNDDASTYSPLLYEAIALKLAAEIAPVILIDGGQKRRYSLLQEFEDHILHLAIGSANTPQGDDSDKGEYSALDVRNP